MAILGIKEEKYVDYKWISDNSFYLRHQ